MSFSLPPPPGINQFNSASWQDWFYKLRTALIQAFNSISAISGLPSPGNNIVHNSYFQEREYTVQDDVVFATTAPYTQHARRWYGVAPSTDFKTLIDTGHDSTSITIKRTAGTNTGAVRLVQILDTEDSLKYAGKDKTLWVQFGVKTGANVISVVFSVYTGTGVDESLASYLAGSWTGLALAMDSDVTGAFPFTFGASIKQIAFEVAVSFDSTSSAIDDEVYLDSFVVVDQGSSPHADGIMLCPKSRAVVRQECNRYYQQMDLYLTTSEISVPIHMRDIPTVTLGDAAAFTTTGTTADALVIKVNGAGDNGIHTVYLNCEL
jgi:hypothetical protein